MADTTQQLEMLTRDIEQTSLLESKQEEDEMDLKDHVICQLRFEADDRIARTQELLRSSKPLFYDFDIAPEAR